MHANIKHPAERILVVSENKELCQHLKAELANSAFAHPVRVDYRYSACNAHPQPMIEFGSTPIDMKDAEAIQHIIANYDLVLSLHCQQIFPKALVDTMCCINVHPGYNPFNRGFYPQVFSIINGLATGATIHVMDTNIDHGGIIAQKKVAVAVSDTSLETYRNIMAAEKELIHEHISNIVAGVFRTTPPTEEGNYNSRKDYQKLCALNLSSVGTLKEHLDLLRAMTHGDFKNAYFTDENGVKYFVRIAIEKEIG